MNLVIDIGNTRVKAAVFEDGRLVEKGCVDALTAKYYIQRTIVAHVRGAEADTPEDALILDRYTPLPIKNLYKTPETLGMDRLAAAVGAWATFPGEDMVVVDFGTAITIDVVTRAGEFVGGNISPGAEMRFRALHEYTAALPQVDIPTEPTPLLGASTREAIEAGVMQGIVYEIEGYAAQMPGHKIIFTGGDAKLFAERLKCSIFVDYDLVLRGLNTILEYNENNE